MPLIAGARIGQYEIVSELGAGGMGEVYRARDTTLGRDVALKCLPESFTHDEERVARFRREAQVLASLNHPHIGSIYGLEQAEGQLFLVLELVDGETLADRIEKRGSQLSALSSQPGPGLPVEEALGIARQIADALESAHEKGIVHRDLKPANIALTSNDQVKVLDFGLAKAFGPAEAGHYDPDVGAGALTHSPTLSLAATQAGVILGTAAYMSPEQAKGKAADKRSDIWAFGCVLYEMLTGTRPFAGDDVSDTLAAVLRGEPAWDALPKDVPEAIRALLKACLEKDRQKRVADIAVARFVMADAGALRAPATTTTVQAVRPSRVRTVAAVAAIVIAAVATTAGATWLFLRPTEAAPRPMRFAIVPSSVQPFTPQGTDRDIAIAPDGGFFVYRTAVGGTVQLAVRAFGELDAKLLAGTASNRGGGARSPFVSPDGQWVGFQDLGAVRKIAVNGGSAFILCPTTGALRGASWGEDDTIVFATTDPSTGLMSVPAGGGEPKQLTKPDAARGELDHLFPSLLPGGRSVLFAVVTAPGPDGSQVAALDLETGEQRVLIRGGSYPQYLNTGHLLYAAAGGLRAVRFDPSSLTVLGDPVPVLDQVFIASTGVANAAVSRQGTLVYVPSTGPVGNLAPRTLAWVDRQGNEGPLKTPPRPFASPRLSPDGRQVVVEIVDATDDVWIFDLGRGSLTRQTFESPEDETPIWSPDGRWIAYSSSRGAERTVFRRRADGSGSEEALWTARNHSHVDAWTGDGRALLVAMADTLGAPEDVVVLPVEGDRTPKPLLSTRFNEHGARLSPDGRWMSYFSNESGRDEVYVQPFPSLAGKWQVSIGGGAQPVWSRKGNELFYRGEGAFMAVRIVPGETFSAGPPEKLFEDRFFTKGGPAGITGYDVAPDGRFLVVKDMAASRQTETGTPASLVVVLNWFEEIKARLPEK